MTYNIPPGKALKQEMSTGFCIKFDTVDKFISATPDIILIMESAYRYAAKSVIQALGEIQYENSTYPHLNAIIKCFQPILHAQTILEASNTPTLIMVIPVLEELRKKL